MAALQTFPINAYGGLDQMSSPQVLAGKPGSATKLQNYEPLIEGGYRKINGYERYGTIPEEWGKLPIRGVAAYKGVVAVIDDMVLHCPDGATWFIVNRKEVTDLASIELSNKDKLPREGTGRVSFEVLTLNGKETLIITDDVSASGVLYVEGDKYTYSEADVAVKGYKFVTHYQDHVVLGGTSEKPGSVAVSTRFSATNFAGSGSWEVVVQDEITGIHTFRDYLYIFCRNSIYRVINLESSADIAVRPVTTKVGCVDGNTIQELGGDIVFLAADGLRYLGATERIDDVSINLVSTLVDDELRSVDFVNGQISSTVLSRKGQYRLFYQDTLGRRKGLIGTLLSDGSFAWSTTTDMNVNDIDTSFEGTEEVTYHIGAPAYGVISVYKHDVGYTFDGSAIEATWKTPWFHMGDGAIRKRLHDASVYLDTEGKAEVQMLVKYDHESPVTLQPEPFDLAAVVETSRWGEFKWGTTKYGSITYPLGNVFLEGSGKWVQFIFKDESEDNTSYIIRGFDLNFTTGGRI